MPDSGEPPLDWGDNPLLSERPDPGDWDRLIEAIRPDLILVVIESRMGERLKRETTAEDILQKAHERAWSGRRKLEWRGLRGFRSWFLTIVDHCIADEADRIGADKRGGGKRTVALSEVQPAAQTASQSAFPGPVQTTTPSRVAVRAEQARAIRAALDELPAELREVVWLRLFEDLPIGVIAERLGIGESAVRHRFRKGSEIYQRLLKRLLASRTGTISPEIAAPAGPGSAP